MLEYSLVRDDKEIQEGTIGNQIKFFEIIDALRNVYERLPNQYPFVYKYFPTSNDGEIPQEEMEAFFEEFKAIGKEKILGNKLTWKNRDERDFLLSNNCKHNVVAKDLYEVINEDGYNLVMEKSTFLEESKDENRITLSTPYTQKGTNWNFFSKIELQDPVIVFQSKSFLIRSLEDMHLTVDKVDKDNSFLYYSNNDFRVIEHVEFGQGEIDFKDFNYIYQRIFTAVSEAITKGCKIKWS